MRAPGASTGDAAAAPRSSPETGEIDLPTLDIVRDYRGETRSTEALPFGIYGEVVRECTVRVGDAVTVAE